MLFENLIGMAHISLQRNFTEKLSGVAGVEINNIPNILTDMHTNKSKYLMAIVPPCVRTGNK